MSEHSMGFIRNNDKRNLILFLGLFLLFAFTATSIASFFVSRVAIRDSILSRELPLTSDNIYSEIQKDLLLPLYVSSTMANDTFLRDWVINGEQDKKLIKRYLSEIKSKYKTVSAFFISEKSRTYYYHSGVLKTVKEDEPRDEWYFRVRHMENPYEINVDPDMANKDAITIFINNKVFDFDHQYIGATGVGLTVTTLKKKIQDYQTTYQRNIFFIDHQGRIILQNQNSQTGSSEGKYIKNINGLSTVADQVLNNVSTSLEYRVDNRTVFLSSRYIPELNWYLMVEQGMDSALQPMRNVLYFNMIICLLVTAIVLIIIAYTVFRYQKNLETRNLELENKNKQIEEQRQQLEIQTGNQAEFNKRLEHLNQEKDEFLGIAAHDLRSPLSGIVGAAELITVEEGTQSKTQTFAEYIVKTSTNMLDLITNLLDVSAIEMERKVGRVKVNYTEVVSNSIKTFTVHARTKQISVLTELSDEPIFLKSRPEGLSTIVNNLISNAIKYSPLKSSIEVELRQEKGLVTFIVKDDGPGLSMGDKKILFTRFARLSPQPTGGESSSGLGLYIVKKMTERLGGEVRCESEYGVGTSFIVEFPIS
jgi:signal transduction histidine kinase